MIDRGGVSDIEREGINLSIITILTADSNYRLCAVLLIYNMT